MCMRLLVVCIAWGWCGSASVAGDEHPNVLHSLLLFSAIRFYHFVSVFLRCCLTLLCPFALPWNVVGNLHPYTIHHTPYAHAQPFQPSTTSVILSLHMPPTPFALWIPSCCRSAFLHSSSNATWRTNRKQYELNGERMVCTACSTLCYMYCMRVCRVGTYFSHAPFKFSFNTYINKCNFLCTLHIKHTKWGILCMRVINFCLSLSLMFYFGNCLCCSYAMQYNADLTEEDTIFYTYLYIVYYM